MRRILIALAAIAALCLPAAAQTVQITATAIRDPAGVPLAQGQIHFLPTNGQGRVQGFRQPGAGQAITRQVDCLVVQGAIRTRTDGGACQLADTDSTNPQHVCFKVTITDSSDDTEVQGPGYDCYQPSLSLANGNFDAFIPNTPGIPLQTLTGGSAANVTYGVTSGTVAAGNDSRIVNAVQALVGNVGTNLPNTDVVAISRPYMASFLHALHSTGSGIAGIVVFGDSRSVVDSTITAGAASSLSVTFGSRWIDLLRKYLQGVYGSHGTGLQAIFWGAGSQNNLVPNADWYSSSTSLTSDCSLGPVQTGGNSYCPLAVIPVGGSLTFSTSIPYDHLRLYYATKSNSGTATISIDGASAGSAGGTSSNPTATLGTSSAVTLGTHTATITATGNPFFLYGVEGVAGTTGVSVHNVSVGSGAMQLFGANPSVEEAFTDLIPEGHQLSIIKQLTNEPGIGETTPQYQTELNNLIAHERGLASAPSIELISDGQDSIGGQPPYFPVLAAVAAAQKTAFVDIRQRWGTVDNPSYFGPDGAHENNAGNAEEFAMISEPFIDSPTPVGGSANQQNVLPSLTVNGPISQSVPGTNAYTFNVFGAGNGAGLPGVMGLYDGTRGKFVWSTNPAGDLFFGTPVSGGNVAAGAGAVASILADGTFGPISQSGPGTDKVAYLCFGTGNGNGLAGTCGLYDNTTSTFVWLMNTTGDIYFDVPLSGGNVAAGVGAKFGLIHDGTTVGFGSSGGSSFNGTLSGNPAAIHLQNTVGGNKFSFAPTGNSGNFANNGMGMTDDTNGVTPVWFSGGADGRDWHTAAGGIGWSSRTDDPRNGTAAQLDTGMCRYSAGVVGVDNGTNAGGCGSGAVAIKDTANGHTYKLTVTNGAVALVQVN